MEARTVPSALSASQFSQRSACGASPVPFLSAAISLMAQGRGGSCSPPGRLTHSLVLFEAGSCCFPLNYRPDKAFLMLLSLLWLQDEHVCCTLCPAGVTLVTCVWPVSCGSHSGGGFPVGCAQFCTHKGKGFVCGGV